MLSRPAQSEAANRSRRPRKHATPRHFTFPFPGSYLEGQFVARPAYLSVFVLFLFALWAILIYHDQWRLSCFELHQPNLDSVVSRHSTTLRSTRSRRKLWGAA